MVTLLLLFSVNLWIIGLFGMFLSSKHIIIILISLELILLGVNINFVVFSIFLDDLLGQVYALFVLTVAAAESSIGLAILIVYYSLRGGISIDFINLLNS